MNKFATRFRSTLSAALLATAACVHAQPATPPAAVTPSVPEQVETAFRYGDFAELERLYALYGKPGVRSPLTGTERVTHFWMGISEVTAANRRLTDGYFQQLDALSRQWSQDHPQSVLAQLLYADTLIAHAWFHRGTGYANTVSPASWAEFGKYLGLAVDQLRRCETLASQDSSWNLQLLAAANGLSWEVDRMLPIFEKGIAKNPDHDQLYFTMQAHLLPKWSGDIDTVERFIGMVTQQTKDKRGLEMYARLYADLSHTEVKQTLFNSTHVSWPKMKQGFEDRLSRYPKADHRNMYAYFACMAKDKATLQEQLRLIGDDFVAVFWGDSPERTYEECKAMAQQL